MSTIADVIAGRTSWAVECRDGFALARELGAGAVDHVIGDPPYDEQTHAGARTLKWTDDKTNPRAKGAASGGTSIAIDFAPLPPLCDILPSLVSSARRWSILFCTGAMLGDYKRAAGGARESGGTWIREGVWHRSDSMPQVTGDRPAVGCEMLAIMHSPGGRMKWNGGGRSAFWSGATCKDARRMHPTKKPLWLMEALVRDFTDTGDLVFDPTAGEGTTGEACLKLGRRFIGCEIDPRYHAMAVERIGRVAARPRQIEIGEAAPMGRQEKMFA